MELIEQLYHLCFFIKFTLLYKKVKSLDFVLGLGEIL